MEIDDGTVHAPSVTQRARAIYPGAFSTAQEWRRRDEYKRIASRLPIPAVRSALVTSEQSLFYLALNCFLAGLSRSVKLNPES